MIVVYVDMDGVVADFDKKVDGLSSDEKQNLIDTDEHFFDDLELIEGAVEGVSYLLNRGFDVYFLSTPPWDNPRGWMGKRLWIEKYFPNMKKKLILTHRKDLNIGDYLIDDRKANGSENFTGHHIHFGQPEFPNWTSVVQYFEYYE